MQREPPRAPPAVASKTAYGDTGFDTPAICSDTSCSGYAKNCVDTTLFGNVVYCVAFLKLQYFARLRSDIAEIALALGTVTFATTHKSLARRIRLA